MRVIMIIVIVRGGLLLLQFPLITKGEVYLSE